MGRGGRSIPPHGIQDSLFQTLSRDVLRDSTGTFGVAAAFEKMRLRKDQTRPAGGTPHQTGQPVFSAGTGMGAVTDLVCVQKCLSGGEIFG